MIEILPLKALLVLDREMVFVPTFVRLFAELNTPLSVKFPLDPPKEESDARVTGPE